MFQLNSATLAASVHKLLRARRGVTKPEIWTPEYVIIHLLQLDICLIMLLGSSTIPRDGMK